MSSKFNSFLDIASDYLAHRKGLLPLLGVLLIIINFIFQIFPLGWITTSNLFLHLGIILAIIGILLAWAL